jgi:hypothetical protein
MACLLAWELTDSDVEGLGYVYATTQVEKWLGRMRNQKPDRGATAPTTQLISKFDAIVEGATHGMLSASDTPPAFRKLRPTSPSGPNVWELRTTDVRLFGWFPGSPRTFIGVIACLKKDLLLTDGSGQEDNSKYEKRINAVVRWRSQNGLEGHVWFKGQDDVPTLFRRPVP